MRTKRLHGFYLSGRSDEYFGGASSDHMYFQDGQDFIIRDSAVNYAKEGNAEFSVEFRKIQLFQTGRIGANDLVSFKYSNLFLIVEGS
jgi:hypothetical protein